MSQRVESGVNDDLGAYKVVVYLLTADACRRGWPVALDLSWAYPVHSEYAMYHR